MTTTQVRPAPSRQPTAPASGLLLAVLLGGLFMSLLDISIVNVAIGPLRDGLHASGAQLQLIVSGYVMTYAVLLITGARLGGRIGHRAVFRAGLAGFVLASAACGMAPTATLLIVCRLVQGGAAAFMLPQVMSLIQICFPAGPQRSRALGWYGLVLALGTVSGQLLGGVLLRWDVARLDWRTVFLVNVPVGLVLLWMSGRSLPRHTRAPRTGLDISGTILLGSIIGLVVVPLVLGRENGWPLWGFIAWGIAALLLPVFVLVERSGAAPVIPGDLLRTPGLLMGLAVVVVTIAGYAAYLFAFAVHLQTTLQLSPLKTGLTFLPLAVGFAVSSLACPRLPARISRTLIPVGLLLCVISFLGSERSPRTGNDPARRCSCSSRWSGWVRDSRSRPSWDSRSAG
ncbi:MFS transporter [Flexivirga alba]|uniref:MFS transporter n=1 Tax=Flexivirga alba TaxID=702742 RepID=A0ABW2AL23_9MICO